MNKISAILLSANLLFQSIPGNSTVFAQTSPQIHYSLNNEKDVAFDISHWKKNADLLALANNDQNLVNSAITIIWSGYTTLQNNQRFKLILEKYFSNDINKLTARLLAIAIIECGLDAKKVGKLWECGLFQILVKECDVPTTKESAKKLSEKKESIVSRLKKTRKLENVTNQNYLGMMMVMEDAANVGYTLTSEDAPDQYYLYTDFSEDDLTQLSLLYHNKWLMVYETLDELILEKKQEQERIRQELAKLGKKQIVNPIIITTQDILNRIGSKTGQKLQYGESRFTWLQTNYFKIPRNSKWELLMTKNEYRHAVWANYVYYWYALEYILNKGQ